MSVCELSKDYPGWNNKVVTVRGLYWSGLRQDCPQKCATGLWPSFIYLKMVQQSGLNDAVRTAATGALTGKHLEVWVTVTGRLQTSMRPSVLGPCDRASWGVPGYGRRGAFPAQIIVSRFVNIELKENPQSPYNYGAMNHPPM
jgi:hypothetical protein